MDMSHFPLAQSYPVSPSQLAQFKHTLADPFDHLPLSPQDAQTQETILFRYTSLTRSICGKAESSLYLNGPNHFQEPTIRQKQVERATTFAKNFVADADLRFGTIDDRRKTAYAIIHPQEISQLEIDAVAKTIDNGIRDSIYVAVNAADFNRSVEDQIFAKDVFYTTLNAALPLQNDILEETLVNLLLSDDISQITQSEGEALSVIFTRSKVSELYRDQHVFKCSKGWVNAPFEVPGWTETTYCTRIVDRLTGILRGTIGKNTMKREPIPQTLSEVARGKQREQT